MLRRRRVLCWLSASLIVLGLSACASGSDARPAGIDVSPIVVDLAESSVPSTGHSGSVTGAEPPPVTDPRADLDIDDQVGDGLTVVMEAVDTDLTVVHIAIETADGVLLGSDLRTEGLQPVTVRLDQPVPGPMELVGRMLSDDGDGILELGVDRPVIDEEGEQVAEDFDYVFLTDDLRDD